MFNLKFISDEKFSTVRNKKIALGEISVGNFTERFESSLSFWNIFDYQNQWIEAAQRILKFDKTAFITNLTNPQTANFITWWTAWKVKERIYFQNQLLIFVQLSEAFDLRNPYKFVDRRTVETEEGEKISEWAISLNDIKEFLKDNLKK